MLFGIKWHCPRWSPGFPDPQRRGKFGSWTPSQNFKLPISDSLAACRIDQRFRVISNYLSRLLFYEFFMLSFSTSSLSAEVWHVHRHKYRRTDRQTDKQTDKKTHTERDIHNQILQGFCVLRFQSCQPGGDISANTFWRCPSLRHVS